MTIGMLLQKYFPPDIRVEKEAKALIKAGYQVHLLAVRKKNQPLEEAIDGLQVHRYIPYENRSFLRKIKNVIFIITHFDSKWIQQIQTIIKRYNIDALHIHDLPLIGVALRSAQSKKIPVIADLHETYPEITKISGPIAKTLSFLGNWEKCEKKWLKLCQHIIVVIDEAKERLISMGFPADKVAVVSNTTNIDFFDSFILDKNITKKYKDNFVISYTGGFDPVRGLDVTIKSMKEVVKQIPRAKLLLIGKRKNTLRLDRLINKLSLNNNVELIDWQRPVKMMNYILLSDICLVPHCKSPFTDTTIPHKLFHYMLAKKPVIVSNCEPLERIINETKAGLVFENNNPQNLAKQIIQIYKNPNQYGKNGYQAIINKYSWRNDAQKLINIYQNLKNIE